MEQSKILELIISAGLAPPKAFTIMITNGCNLYCRHCWPDSRFRDVTSPVPEDSLKRLIRSAVHLGIGGLRLTGGEPLTHPEWFEILKYACGFSGLREIRLQTNATLLGNKEAKALAALDCKSLVVQVSLEGIGASTHDRIRGTGTFELTCNGLKHLADVGLGPQTEVAFTETEHNFEDIPDLLHLVDELGIARLVSGTLVKAGRAAQADGLSLPTPSQYRRLLELYHDDPEFRERYRRMGNIACLEWFKGRWNCDMTGCVCIETPYITADGLMYPCLMLPVKRYGVSGVFGRQLGDVIREGLRLWAEIPCLYRQRSKPLKECIECPGRIHCAGGCMGRAYVGTGDPVAVEDRCELRRAVYTWHPD